MDKMKPTPAAEWREQGKPDPHGNRYDCERATLTMGHLTDDQLANEAFLNYDRRPNLEDLISGRGFMPIVYMTAVKDRIRWLSRKLVEATDQLNDWRNKAHTAQSQYDAVEQMRPIWAQGFTDESVASQVTSAALTELWKLLGVENQTEAVLAIEKLKTPIYTVQQGLCEDEGCQHHGTPHICINPTAEEINNLRVEASHTPSPKYIIDEDQARFHESHGEDFL